jgi:uncharacterized protein YbaR (Trm112 family)
MMVVGLDPQLMEILRCPCPDHGELRSGTAADPDGDALTCVVCARSFPVTDGIPVMLLEQALPGTGPTADQTKGYQGRDSELDTP